MLVRARSLLFAPILMLVIFAAGCVREPSTYQYSVVVETVRCPPPDSFGFEGDCPKPTTKGGRFRFAVSVERQSVIRHVVEFEPGNSGIFTEELEGCAVFDARNWSCRSSFEARMGSETNTVTTFSQMRDGEYRMSMVNSLGTAFSYASKGDAP
jgi:hypothetical protein